MNNPWKTSSHSASGANCVETSGPWHISTHSATAETCVEVSSGQTVRVRDTKDRERGWFAVDGRAWTAFIDNIRNEEN